MSIKSSSVKLQTDYLVTMNLINNMLDKVTPTPTPGSILVGKQYAVKYNDNITKMLSGEYIDKDMLLYMRQNVRTDLEFILDDCNKRFYSYHIKENKNMINMILDFILSL
jgi:hypothetical protein